MGLTDENIKLAVERRFFHETAVPWRQVNVSTTDGVVTLSGTVDNLLAKERATALAETVRGVRAVINNLEVQPIQRSDEEIRNDVKNALATDPVTDSFKISASVNNGVATLAGSASSWREQQLAVDVARSVKGVREVKDQLVRQEVQKRADEEVAEAVRRILQVEAWIDATPIQVEVKDGKVILSGAVSSAAERSLAAIRSWAVAGVVQVDDSRLQVDPSLREKMKREPRQARIPEGEVKSAVQDALKVDPRVDSSKIGVEVQGSTVRLSGTVDVLRARKAAEQTAKGTVGVSLVENQIKVRPEKAVPDATIAQNVREGLVRNPYIAKHEVNVNVEDGTVTLLGEVDSRFQKSVAEEVASRVNGVVSVKNRLIVVSPTLTYYHLQYPPYITSSETFYPGPFSTPAKTDPEIAQGIKDHMWWSWFIDADEVTVSVENGVATLTGTVDSWMEYNAATENAFDGGAVAVRNRLSVE